MYGLKVSARGKQSLKIQKLILLSTLSALVVLALFTSTAYGITGNYSSDSRGYTGVVVLFSDSARQIPIGFCSGFLISPNVMITAGHSLINVAAVSVCFDKGPIAYTIIDGVIVYYGTDTIYNGVPVTYPGYVPATSGKQEFSTSDIGLIRLDNSVSGVTIFPKLPAPDFVDTLKTKTDLTLVGYGFQYQVTPKNNGVMNSWTGMVTRNSANVQLLSTHFAGSDKYLKLSANAAQNKGGISFGDSGGPVIYTDSNGQDIVIALNAYVSNANCAGVTYHTRLDSAELLGWINQHRA
jgi:hypothetical protein